MEADEESQAEVAERFGVHLSTLEKWWYRHRTTGSCAATPQRHGPRRKLEPFEAFLRAEVKQQPDLTLAELCARVQAVHGVSVSTSVMCEELKRLKLPRKKSRSTTANAIRRA